MFLLRFFLVDVYITSIIYAPMGEAWALSLMWAFYICFPFILKYFHTMEKPTGANLCYFILLSFCAWVLAISWQAVYSIFVMKILWPNADEMISLWYSYFSYRLFLPARILHFAMGIVSASMCIHNENIILHTDTCSIIIGSVVLISFILSAIIFHH